MQLAIYAQRQMERTEGLEPSLYILLHLRGHLFYVVLSLRMREVSFQVVEEFVVIHRIDGWNGFGDI